MDLLWPMKTQELVGSGAPGLDSYMYGMLLLHKVDELYHSEYFPY